MDVNTQIKFQNTDTPILLFAIFISDKEFIDYLLQNGVDVNYNSVFWGTALHQTVKMQLPKTAKKLINAGAEVNLREIRSPNFTPLHIAVENNFYELAKLLVKHGADVDILSLNEPVLGVSPLQIAVNSNKDKKIINLMLKNIKGSRGKLNYRMLKKLKYI